MTLGFNDPWIQRPLDPRIVDDPGSFNPTFNESQGILDPRIVESKERWIHWYLKWRL